MSRALCPPVHLAPFRVAAFTHRGDDPLSHGALYFGLCFPDGSSRGSVAVFLYDEVGVRQQLVDLGYRVEGPYRAVRSS